MGKQTPLHDIHIKLGAKMVEFAGWEMPIQYTGVIDEHKAVREYAGIFDVSHMGEIELTGPDAFSVMQYLTPNDVSHLVDGQAQYSMLLNERGTVIDDIILYRIGPERFLIVVNASNTAKDFNWILSHSRGNVNIANVSDDYAMIAFQGPLAAEILQTLTSADLSKIGHYHFAMGDVDGVSDCIIARTGYTGEDGFEIFCRPQYAVKVWTEIMERGKSRGIKPTGLGARDTLRTEMKYSLYGHEITDETNPFEAGLAWVVKLDQPDDFIGKEELKKIKASEPSRKLVGFKMLDRAIPREGYNIVANGKTVGRVTSGTMSPTLGEPIGIGFVPPNLAEIGSKFSIDIRGKLKEAEVVKTPFYRRKT